MKMLKKIIAAVMVCCMLVTMCACHGKDEVAVTVDGIEIKSGLYLAAMVFADMDARTIVDNNLASQAEANGTTVTEETDYSEQTVEGMAYDEYVKSQTLKFCKEYAAIKKLVNAKTISLTEDELYAAKYYAQYMWSTYSQTFEANGVSYESFEEYSLYSNTSFESWAYYSSYRSKYFDYFYDEGASKEVSKETLTKEMKEHYVLAYELPAKITSESKEEEIAAEKKKLEDFKKRLEKGEAFKDIYLEYNETTEEKLLEELGYTKDNPPKQKDIYATILGDENTQYANDNFAEVYELKDEKSKVKIIEAEDGSAITLYVLLDITSDSYYLDTVLRKFITHDLKDDEFNAHIADLITKVSVTENSWAIDRFDVDDIEYITSQSTTAY